MAFRLTLPDGVVVESDSAIELRVVLDELISASKTHAPARPPADRTGGPQIAYGQLGAHLASLREHWGTLSPRQLQAVELRAGGQSTKAIAVHLGKSEKATGVLLNISRHRLEAARDGLMLSPRRRAAASAPPAAPAIGEPPEPEPAATVDGDALVVEHRAWADDLARRRARRYPGMDADDAVSEAMIALVKSSRSWDPAKGAPFRAWAGKRIVGAIIDLHRENDPVGRDERRAQKEGRETRLARRGLPHRVQGDVADLERARAITTSLEPDQIDAVARAELLAVVRSLPPRIATIMERHAFGDEGLREIGESLGITESRVCQIVQEGRQLLAAARAGVAPIPPSAPAPEPRAAAADPTARAIAELRELAPWLGALRPSERRVYDRRVAGDKPAAIALALGLTEPSVRTNLWALRRRLESARAAAALPPPVPLAPARVTARPEALAARARGPRLCRRCHRPGHLAKTCDEDISDARVQDIASACVRLGLSVPPAPRVLPVVEVTARAVALWDRSDPDEDLTDLDLGVPEPPATPPPATEPVLVTPPPPVDLGHDPTAAQARVRAKLRVLDNGRVRAKTISADRRLGRDERADGAELLDPSAYDRPATRGDCSEESRPCPWVSCPHHLALDVDPNMGGLKLNFPHLEVWEMAETCSLDVADRGGLTLEEVGAILNLTRERIRQVEVRGLARIKDTTGDELGLPPERPDAAVG